MAEDFNYMVERKAQDRICFLSSKERPFLFNTRTETAQCRTYMAPSSIDQFLNKIRSKRGVGGLASQAPRFPRENLEQVPGPNCYNPKPITCKGAKSSCLGGLAPRLPKLQSTTPGPGAYLTYTSGQRLKIKMKHTFGGRMSMVPTVEARCIPKPVDKCAECGEICTGDYWQKDKSTFLCVPCMRRLWFNSPTKDLKKYKRVRDCSFMHQHNGTTAAVHLLKDQTLFTRIMKENYFDVYFGSH